MAHTKSAKKHIRQDARRREINGWRVSRIRTFIKNTEKAIRAGDRETAMAALRVAEPEIRRGINKGVIHHNTADRKISRLNRAIKALG